ncbi:PREDICTED: uncharacterized protein LOC104816084 [Tarenaya hassleriana]|uniref:uncharacterized protein LOC104816084 n=1 Tax=Tarenaya hassleriana TaxID=28532 RepID=UPI00053C0BD6|nr:PREDICTED: uncharacterized protein LOC104816084 [Tarenaya hassleriana]
MSLEHYVDFFISRDSHGFTVNFLNQVIQMHGFMKIRSPKNVIADAIDTLDLVEPWRSTVKQNVTSSTATSTLILDDVIADLEYLKWQECCMTSLQILNAEKEAAKIAPAMSKFKDKSSKRKKSSTKRDDSLRAVIQ